MGVSNYGCSYASTFTKVRFDISAADSENLALTITYGEVRDEWVPSFTNYYTRPGTLPPPTPQPEPDPEPPLGEGVSCGDGDGDGDGDVLTSADVQVLVDDAQALGATERQVQRVRDNPCAPHVKPDPAQFVDPVLVAGGTDLALLEKRPRWRSGWNHPPATPTAAWRTTPCG